MLITSNRSRGLVLSHSTEAHVYSYFALAMALTLLGTYVGVEAAGSLLRSGIIFFLLIIELAILFTARLWSEKSPINYVLFALFPFLSGITFAPFILYVLLEYVNGVSILLNALASTVFMAAAAAVFARMGTWNLAGIGRALFFALLGLLALGVLQLFFPALQTGKAEMAISGAGVVIFAVFTAYDVQRISKLARGGSNPLLLALHLYLDIFNLFIFVARFMLALSGNRRD